MQIMLQEDKLVDTTWIETLSAGDQSRADFSVCVAAGSRRSRRRGVLKAPQAHADLADGSLVQNFQMFLYSSDSTLISWQR